MGVVAAPFWLLTHPPTLSEIIPHSHSQHLSEDELRYTPLKSHIISTTLAQLIEAVDIVAWEAQPDEVHADELFENLETALDILKDRLGYAEDNVE